MATSVTITGSGTPMLAPGRAGPGALIRHDSTAVQVDAGRATVLRMAEGGFDLTELDALLVTHHHSDHLLGITDLVLARWFAFGQQPCPPLSVYSPIGPAIDYLEHLFDHLEPDIQSRIGVTGYPIRPEPTVHAFESATFGQTDVATMGEVRIETTTVDHGDLAPAVAYRFTTPDGVIVISGDTTVCPAIESFARGADVLVHEAFSRELMAHRGAAPERIDRLAHHHADATAVGAMAARLEIPELVITHMIPSPQTDADRKTFIAAVRDGGHEGSLTVADDLYTATI